MQTEGYGRKFEESLLICLFEFQYKSKTLIRIGSEKLLDTFSNKIFTNGERPLQSHTGFAKSCFPYHFAYKSQRKRSFGNT